MDGSFVVLIYFAKTNHYNGSSHVRQIKQKYILFSNENVHISLMFIYRWIDFN